MKRISQRRLALRLILSAIENCHFWLEDRDEETVGAYFDLIWLVMEPFDTGSAVDAHLNSINDCDSMYQHIQLLREAAEHLDSITDDEFHYEGSADYNRLLRVVSDHTPLGGGYWEPVKSTADQPSHRTTTDEPRYR